MPTPSTDEPAQHATWPQVEQAAAPGGAGKDALDIAWIDGLPQPIRDSIDIEFSEAKRDAQTRGQRVAIGRKLDAELARRRQELRQQTAARLGAMPRRALDAAISADPEYQRAEAALRAELRAQREQQLQQQEAAADAAPRGAGQPAESVTAPSGAKINRLEGAARARTDFMSWAIEMTGSAAKAKAHYQGIRQVAGRPGVWLAADAAARFEAAVRDFEAAHPGYTIGSTGGHAQRGLHQARWGVGMHGHSLALAVDILAYDNPNLKSRDGDPTHLNHFFLKRFGRDEQGKARATMNLAPDGDERIEALGKRTVTGQNTPQDQAFVEDIKRQFGELVATSRRFQASFAANLPVLQEARNHYFTMRELEGELAALTKALAQAPVQARKQVAKEKIRDPKERAAREAEVETELKRMLDAKRASLEARRLESEKLYKDNKHSALAEWAVEIDKDKVAASSTMASATAALQGTNQALVQLRATPSTQAELAAFAAAQRIELSAALGAGAARRRLEAELKKKLRAQQEAVDYASKELGILQAAKERLDQPERLFGQPVKKDEGVYETHYVATELPLVQYLEHGFVRDDEMPPSSATSARKGVFNAEVVATLARYGFSPGSTFGDTMHFDFIEGYSTTVPGGRSQANMKRNRFGPRGTMHEEAP